MMLPSCGYDFLGLCFWNCRVPRWRMQRLTFIGNLLKA